MKVVHTKSALYSVISSRLQKARTSGLVGGACPLHTSAARDARCHLSASKRPSIVIVRFLSHLLPLTIRPPAATTSPES